MKLIQMVVLSAAVACAMHASATPMCQIKSANDKIPLLELYTSEGCSSCPPADRFVSALHTSGYAPGGVTPLAFHVDYWDYIGWEDRFAQATFTQRQRAIAATNHLNTIYTPQFVVDGQDVRRWFSSSKKVIDNLDNIRQSKPGAVILLDLEQKSSVLRVSANVRITDTSALELQPALYLALVENDLDVDIQRGENEGKKLHHDNVVRSLVGPFSANSEGVIQLTHEIVLARDYNPQQLSLAAFVQTLEGGLVLQSVASPLCAP